MITIEELDKRIKVKQKKVGVLYGLNNPRLLELKDQLVLLKLAKKGLESTEQSEDTINDAIKHGTILGMMAVRGVPYEFLMNPEHCDQNEIQTIIENARSDWWDSFKDAYIKEEPAKDEEKT